MALENVVTVVNAFATFIDRDAEAFAGYFAEDAELMLPRNLLEGGSYKGPEGAKQTVADAFDMWADIRARFESIREVGDQVLAVIRITNVGKAGTPTIENEGIWLARLRDGKIVHWRPYQTQSEALEAAGLSE